MRPGRRRWAATERVLEGFPDRAHDVEVDAGSGALEMLNPPMKSWAAYEIAPQDAEAILAAQQRPPHPIRPVACAHAPAVNQAVGPRHRRLRAAQSRPSGGSRSAVNPVSSKYRDSCAYRPGGQGADC